MWRQKLLEAEDAHCSITKATTDLATAATDKSAEDLMSDSESDQDFIDADGDDANYPGEQEFSGSESEYDEDEDAGSDDSSDNDNDGEELSQKIYDRLLMGSGDKEDKNPISPDPNDDEEVRRFIEEHQTISRRALSYWLYKVGISKVKTVYQVRFELPPARRQYVVLLHDGGYLCTCRLIESKGIVCGHLFRLMRAEPDFVYHIGLIARRWFTHSCQDKEGLEELIRERHVIFAESHSACPTSHPTTGLIASQTVNDPPFTSKDVSGKARSSKKQRYAELFGLTKTINARAVEDEQVFEHIKGELAQLIRRLGSRPDISSGLNQEVSSESVEPEELPEPQEVVHDPKVVLTKGRKRKKRYMAAEEIQQRAYLKKVPYTSSPPADAPATSRSTRRPTTCGSCGATGHNKRRCPTFQDLT